MTLRTLLLCGVAATFGAGTLAGCSEDGAGEAEVTRSLRTVSPDTGEIRRVVGATGKVAPRDEVTVGSEVSGRLVEVRVDFNSVVKAGDILAVIDPITFQNRLKQVDSQIESTRADSRVREASIESARVGLDNAELQLTRRQGLFERDAISQAQLEAAQRDVGVARGQSETQRSPAGVQPCAHSTAAGATRRKPGGPGAHLYPLAH